MNEFLSFFVDSEGYGYLITPAQENFLGTDDVSLLSANPYHGKQENNNLTIEIEYNSPNFYNYHTLDPNYLPDNGAGVGYTYYGISNYEANPNIDQSLPIQTWEDDEGTLWHSVIIELNETLASGQEVYFDFGYNIVFTMLPEESGLFLYDYNDDYQIRITYYSGEFVDIESDHFFAVLDIKDTSSISSFNTNNWTLSFEGEKTHKIDKNFISEPNWSENSEESYGYIKNRTHYISNRVDLLSMYVDPSNFQLADGEIGHNTYTNENRDNPLYYYSIQIDLDEYYPQFDGLMKNDQLLPLIEVRDTDNIYGSSFDCSDPSKDYTDENCPYSIIYFSHWRTGTVIHILTTDPNNVGYLELTGIVAEKLKPIFIPEEYCTRFQTQKMIDEAISSIRNGNEVSW